VLAGSAYLEHVTGPLDVVAHMGSVKLNGVIDSGTSRIRCEAGSVYVQLLRGSSVKVRARSVLGRVALPEPAGVGRGSYAIGDDREVVVGGGAALLEIETNMGSVKVGSDA
jgi:hypothetical protein